MDLQRTQKLAGIPLTEALVSEAKTKALKLDAVELGEYKSSEDFENGFNLANQAAKLSRQVLDSDGFKGWMKESSRNYGWNDKTYKKVLAASVELTQLLDKLYDEMEELS